MPYSKSHKENSRRRILDSAVKLFSANGYDGVTLDELMQDAKLTRGAFYAHFDSKQTLYTEAVLHAACHGPVTALNGDADEATVKTMVRAYLDMSHVKQQGAICPLAFLVTDVANQQNEIRDTYTQVYRDVIERINTLPMIGDMDSALAISALMIGGVAVARALNDEELSKRLLEACYKTSERLM
ncbi:MAG TPA: TetR/AcrR family transcriptional regulator [Gallionella sp.]|nr:TetR/AcrR family transcriptional regulator [Gallionella sp.]